MKFLKKFFHLFSFARMSQDEAYLARSSNLYELEARLRTLERSGSLALFSPR